MAIDKKVFSRSAAILSLVLIFMILFQVSLDALYFSCESLGLGCAGQGCNTESGAPSYVAECIFNCDIGGGEVMYLFCYMYTP